MKKLLVISLSFLSLSSLAICRQNEYKSGSYKVHVVELYTSEGCSSCPPADRWLNSLIDNKKLYTNFIPLKFHVDYWNYLGWKDRFSKNEYTQRQRRYAREWGSRNIYTPAFTLNGDEWRTRNQFKLRKREKAAGELNVIKTSKNKFEATFTTKEKSLDKLNISFAILGNSLKNKILRGENKGKDLYHNFVVLNLQTQKLINGKAILELPEIDVKTDNKSIVFWIEKENSLRAIQSTGGCL